MAILFLLLWVILNGRCTLEVLLLGLAITVPIYIFFCVFFDFSLRKDWNMLKRGIWFFGYVFVLLREIVKANFQVIYLILSSKLEVEPCLVKFRTKLSQNHNKVLLANSITLTPGTITVKLEKNEYLVHCLDNELAEGIEDSVFVHMLEENEKKEERV